MNNQEENMYFEKNHNPGLLINLDRVIEINWITENKIQFNTTQGVITWEYDSEDEASQDITALLDTLRKKGELVSAELDESEK